MAKKKVQLQQNTETAKALYERLKNDRAAYVTRAEECAKYTIPSLFPKDGDNGSTTYETPYQSVGARGVNNLAAKLMLALLPPNSPFFKLSMTEKVRAELGGKISEVEKALSKLEGIINNYIETHQIRVTISEALKTLLVAGNALLFLPPLEGGIKLYKLNSYVIQRDALGNVILIVAVDKIAYAALPPNVQALAAADGGEVKAEEIIEIHTVVRLEGDNYVSYQEIKEQVIPGSEQTYPVTKTPWIPLRMTKIDGESYGRSFVEEYLGDLKSLEGLRKAIVELSAICAKVIFLVNTNGGTNPRRLQEAKPGDFVSGRADDIAPLVLQKYNDMQVASQTAAELKADLFFVFLLNSAVQRGGERVTAEEIRYVAGELEDTLGGVYSILSQELQLPLVRRLMTQLMATGLIPDLPDNTVEPSITTGLEALGRGQDLNKLDILMKYVATTPGAPERLNIGDLMTRVATALGINTEGLIKTDEEVAAEQQQQMMLQMANRAAPQIAGGVMNNMGGGGQQ